ncbi:ribonuclease domain-containing protein [Streptococcus oralis]|uniref:ribonuclease domain-containing protein n=1 Tax=Streptococcus oralis TaxID=1303 RepID=UPI002001208F|nr:ribonuclease domain-containing protein [Streptococcus oralis]
MTKDVELHSSTWKTMKQAITGLTENATVSSSGYGNYTNAQAGSYSTGTTSTGFAKRVEDLVKISEKVQKLIKEKDTDGVVSYTYHDETSTAQTLQAKLSTLERYAENVNTYINKKIDRPFYEAMDKVGAKLEALNIQKYKTTNKIGYKRIESVKDPYGHPVGTKEVTPPEIGIDELYKVDSPYKASLKKSYEEYKKSKDYKDSRLTETEYVQVMHQTRSFEYVSIDDEKSTTEMWRDLTLTAATVVLYVFCPPAGAVLSTVVAAAEMYSAASGKDWGTGRELDGNERVMRGAFALLDLIPAGKYLGGLAKIGKTAGITAVKTSIKTAIKEGVEQGARNLDNFKGILKSTKGFGDNVYQSLSTYRKQLTRHLQNTVDEGLLNLSKATQEGLERAKQFTLEVPTVVVRETSTGSQIMRFEKMSKSLGDTGLGKSLDNLASKAKQVENTRLDKLRARNAFYGNKVDDVAKGAKEAAEQAGKKARQEFRQEASEQLAKHSDEIANTAKVVDKVDDAVDANRIPRYVEDTISQINSNKGNPPDGFKGGKLYKNKPLNGEELLPDGTKYKEYDVHPYQKGIPRGPERIVIGEDGSVWYTQDHYQTFTRIK